MNSCFQPTPVKTMPSKSVVVGVSIGVALLSVLIGFLKYSKEILAAFKTWSLISSGVSTVVVLSYFAITGVYNWHRQYRQSRQEQQVTEPVDEEDWKITRKSKVLSGFEATADPKRLLEQLKVFHYLETGLLEQLTKEARVVQLAAGQALNVERTEMAFVGTGKFSVAFEGESALRVPIGPGGTLTSYANAIRSLATAYFARKSSEPIKGPKITINALEDNSIAIILTEASFKQLVQCSDLAVAHLTQIMLTRFKRATLPLLLNYFHLDSVMTAFLPYFLYRPSGLNSAKFSELLDSIQKTDRLKRLAFSYLISAFSLDHSKFTSIEASTALLAAHISIHESDSGKVLQREGQECRGAFLILEGNLQISFGASEHHVCGMAGDFVGIISSLMGKCSVIQVTVPQDSMDDFSASCLSLASDKPSQRCTYALISQHLLEMISERDPKLLFANIPSYSAGEPIVEFLDLCVDWQQRPCEANVREGNEDRVIKVLHGRVRESVKQREFGIGSFIGEELLFLKPKSEVGESASFVAVRQSELATIPILLIEAMITSKAAVASAFLPRLLARQQSIMQEMTAAKRKIDPIKTICLLPIGICSRAGVHSLTINAQRNSQMRLVEAVEEGLEAALSRHNVPWTSIDSGRAAELMGRQLFTTIGTLKMNEFLAAQEDISRILIYVADSVFSSWTKQCIQQADLILLVADVEDEVIKLGDLERQMLQLNPLVNVELCLTRFKPAIPTQTRKWLRCRPWIRAHHHLLLQNYDESGNEASKKGLDDSASFPLNASDLYSRNIASAVSLISMVPFDLLNSLIRKSRDLRSYLIQQRQFLFQDRSIHRRISVSGLEPHSSLNIHVVGDDFGRLARRLLGRSLGLVLGGGGARGIAHVGIIRAFQEAGLEFDLVGGTSIGAFVGGLMAREQAINRTLSVVSGFSQAMSSKWRQALDLTYPATSWFSGHAFNRALWKFFGFAGIEDFPVPFFAVTTDLTRSRLQIHRSGPAWQYIRASMSLSGFLPPVCDARDGTLLVDGGYLANVPMDQMLNGTMTELSGLVIGERARRGECEEDSRDALAAAVTVAIDVGRASDRVPIYYGEALSGWTVLGRKFKLSLMQLLGWPLKEKISVPLTLDEIQFRLAYASSAGLLSRTLHRSHAQLRQELDSSKHSFVTARESTSDFGNLPTVFYLRPPGVQDYGTLDFHKWDRIMRVGYEYGKSIVKAWQEDGTLELLWELQGKMKNLKETETAQEALESSHDRCSYCEPNHVIASEVEAIERRKRRSSI